MAGKLSEEQRAEIVRRYEAGEPAQRIQRELKLGHGAVRNLLLQLGLPVRDNTKAAYLRYGRDYTQPSTERLQQLYWQEGRSSDEIAEMCGVSAPTVVKWLKSGGIRLRTLSEAHRLSLQTGRRQLPAPPSPEPMRQGWEAWKITHPGWEKIWSQRAGAASARKRRNRRWVPCYWCGQKISRKASKLASQSVTSCCRSHSALSSQWFRWRKEQPRPLILSALRDIASGESNEERLWRLAAEIGAGEPEIIEVMLEART